MKIRLTVLCENSAGLPFKVIGEHGFACYVETEKGNYLFDTGQGAALVPNALTLNKDLRSIEAIMISHGHYDHTGGLPAALGLRGKVPVYGHSAIFTERFFEFGGVSRAIGIPFRRSYLESLGADFRLNDGWTEVGPGIHLTGQIPRKTSFEKGDANMVAHLPDGTRLDPDPILDDLSMVIESDQGLILVLGCAHAGLVNILNYVIEKTGKEQIYAIIGGTHLGFSSEEQFQQTLEAIEQYKIERIGVSHCTGMLQASRLHMHFKERFFFGNAGSSLEV